MRLSHRIEALERVNAPDFAGYASVWLPADQSKDDAKAAWEHDNGPIGKRQVIFWRCSSAGAQCA